MSVLLDEKETTIVQRKNGEYVYIDTRWTMDNGWETMVFKCNKNGKVANWGELDCNIYETKEDANEGHYSMVDKWMHR